MNEQEDIIVLGQEGGRENDITSMEHKEPHREKVVIAGIIGGVSGALIVAGIFGALLSQRKFESMMPEKKAMESAEQKQIVTESDAMIVDTIEKSMLGVVSIIISKDVPKLQRFQSPFGGFPFFFENPSDNNGSSGSEKKQIGSGSGFFVSSDGLIVTNKHVVSDLQAEYTVLVGEKNYPAVVLARDPSNDIALLKIDPASTRLGEAGGSEFTTLPLGDSETLKVGETVLAVGNPLGEFANSVSRGIISGLKRTLMAGTGRGDSEQLSWYHPDGCSD
jgi:serine protease Do